MTSNYVGFHINDKKTKQGVMTVCIGYQVDNERLVYLHLKASKFFHACDPLCMTAQWAFVDKKRKRGWNMDCNGTEYMRESNFCPLHNLHLFVQRGGAGTCFL